MNLSLRDILTEGVGHWLSKQRNIRDVIFHKPTTGMGQAMNNHNFSYKCSLYAFSAFWDDLAACRKTIKSQPILSSGFWVFPLPRVSNNKSVTITLDRF
jgi:hypothetical protein